MSTGIRVHYSVTTRSSSRLGIPLKITILVCFGAYGLLAQTRKIFSLFEEATSQPFSPIHTDDLVELQIGSVR